MTPETLLGSLPEPDAGDLVDADDIGSEIAHLWVGTGLRSAREVRIGLRPSLLPDTQLRMHEVQNRLRVEFSCTTHRAADWLDRKLDLLARELGERLDRDVELAVYLGDGRLVRACNWAREVS